MTEVRETKLPGVGVRHEFTTADSGDVGVIVHHDGRRELVSYGADDPDACSSLITLSEHDTQTLAEILGVSHVSETVGEVRQDIHSLAIEWIELPPKGSMIGSTVGDVQARSSSRAAIVAIIREDEPIPSPGSDIVLEVDDVLVAVGDSGSLDALRALLGAC